MAGDDVADAHETIEIRVDGATLQGELVVPDDARGVVLFVQASGRARTNPRDRLLAAQLQQRAFATLLLDLLTSDERLSDEVLRHLRYDVETTSERVIAAVDRLGEHPATRDLSIGCLGLGVGAAAALVAAAERPQTVSAVVARGGRPDLAGPALERVRAPSLFVVGGQDTVLEELSLLALHRLPGETGLAVVPGTTHLFEEPAAFAEATALTADWFAQHLVRWMRRSGERVIASVPRARRSPRLRSGRVPRGM